MSALSSNETNGNQTGVRAVRASLPRKRSLKSGAGHPAGASGYDGAFWTLAALACAVAVGCVPVFSAREGLSAIPQYAAILVVLLAGFGLFLRIPRVHPGVICYVALVAMWAVTFERDEADAYYTFVKLAVFALAVHVLIRTPRQLLLVLGGYSVAAMIGLLINWGEIRELRYAMETVERAGSNIRFDGTFSNANRAGIFAAMALVSGLIVFFNLRHRARWLFLVAGVGGGLIIGGLSGSRTGMLGIMIAGLAVPFMAVAGERGKVFVKAGKATLLAALAIGIAATTLLQLPQFERFTRLTEGAAADGSTTARWGMAQASYDVWKAHPIAGAGFRGFHKVSEFAGRSAHTAFGTVLADGGLIGFTLFCTWYFLPGLHLLGLARRYTDRKIRRLAVGLLVFLAVFVVGSIFSHLHGSRDLIPLWAGICGFVQQQRSLRVISPIPTIARTEPRRLGAQAAVGRAGIS